MLVQELLSKRYGRFNYEAADFRVFMMCLPVGEFRFAFV